MCIHWVLMGIVPFRFPGESREADSSVLSLPPAGCPILAAQHSNTAECGDLDLVEIQLHRWLAE